MLKQEPGCYTWFKNDYPISLPLRSFIDLLLMVCTLYGDPCKIYFWTRNYPLAIQEGIVMDPIPFNKSSWTITTLIDFMLPVAGNVTKPYPYWSSPELVLLISEEGKWTKILKKVRHQPDLLEPDQIYITWKMAMICCLILVVRLLSHPVHGQGR